MSLNSRISFILVGQSGLTDLLRRHGRLLEGNYLDYRYLWKNVNHNDGVPLEQSLQVLVKSITMEGPRIKGPLPQEKASAPQAHVQMDLWEM